MMILLKQAEVYAPEYLGIRDVLVGANRIEAIGERLEGGSGCRVVDASGMKLVPGLIDRHVHVMGGGGEGSFHTRTPETELSDFIKAGVTTVVGLLGTDDMTRSVEGLTAKVKALKEEGMSAYALCGSYGYPPVTITGSVKKDVAFIDEILGVKLALSDHRAPNVTLDELIRLGSDVRTAGMIGGKPGFVTIHMGSGPAMLDLVFEALEKTDIPVKTFQPTHMGRNEKLFDQGIRPRTRRQQKNPIPGHGKKRRQHQCGENQPGGKSSAYTGTWNPLPLCTQPLQFLPERRYRTDGEDGGRGSAGTG